MRSILIIFISSIFLLFSCKVKDGQEATNFDFEQYFQNIEKANTCLGEDESFDQLGARLNVVLKAPLDTLKSAIVLKTLYYDAIERAKVAKPRTNQRCIDINVGVKDYTIEVIGNVGTEEAMDVLISIYQDKNLSLIGANTRGLVNAMTKYGQPMLQKIEPIKEERPAVSQQVIQMIKSGQPSY